VLELLSLVPAYAGNDCIHSYPNLCHLSMLAVLVPVNAVITLHALLKLKWTLEARFAAKRIPL
jgi:hypothetical protein